MRSAPLALIAGGDRVEVGRVGRVGLSVDGLDAGRLELRLHALDHRRGERVVLRRVRRGLRPPRRGSVLTHREHVGLVRRGRLLGEEQVLEAAGEHVRRAAGRLDVDHLVLLGDRGGREVQQRGERAEQQVDLVLRDQARVVGDDGVLVAGVVAIISWTLRPSRPPCLFVDLLPRSRSRACAAVPGSEKLPVSGSEMPILIGAFAAASSVLAPTWVATTSAAATASGTRSHRTPAHRCSSSSPGTSTPSTLLPPQSGAVLNVSSLSSVISSIA